jgi:hypothetical protein
LRGVETRFSLRKLAGEPGGFRARLLQHRVLGVPLVLAHLQPLTVEVRFKGGHTLAGVLQPFVEPAVLFAQRVAFAGLLRQP